MPVQIDLITHRAKVSQAPPAIGEHHHQIAQHHPGLCAERRWRVDPIAADSAAREPNPVRDPGQQAAAGMPDLTVAVRLDH